MKVLSLFDGISCGMVALKKCGFDIESYDAYEIDKSAITISRKNYPEIKQHGSVVDADFTQFLGYDLLIGGSPCLSGDTLVLTQNGYERIDTIQTGTMVLSNDGFYHKVLNNFKQGIKTTYSIKGMCFDEIRATRNHMFYVRKKKMVYNSKNRKVERVFSEPEFVSVEKLMSFDENGIPNYKNYYLSCTYSHSNNNFVWNGVEININQFKKTIKNTLNTKDENLWYIVGRWLGDGWFSKRKGKNRKNKSGIVICCSKKEREELELKIPDYFKYTVKEERTVCKFFFRSVELAAFLENFGEYSYGKKIPGFVFDLDERLLKQMLKGYFDSDGCFKEKQGIKSYISVGRELLYGISQCELKVEKKPVGIYKIKTKELSDIEGRIVKNRQEYQLSVKTNSKKQTHSFVEDDILWYPIKSIEKYGNEEVYDIEVEDTHNFIANNAITHNCQGFSFAGEMLNFEDPQSKLFFEFVRALKEVEPKYFLLENVKMPKRFENVITEYLGVKPILINSNLVSAQNRQRLYWTNIPNIDLPEDRGILLKDIIEPDLGLFPLSTAHLNAFLKSYPSWKESPLEGKSKPILASYYRQPPYCPYVRSEVTESGYRRLTPVECERLQNLPDNYTEGVSNSARYKTIGNGWTVDVIAHILKNIK